MELRPYQEKAISEIRELYSKGERKVLLHLATGGGKTLIFCTIMKGVQERSKRAMLVVRGKKLVDQASKRLDREGVDHGVIMSGHWRYRPNLSIQVCSIDTLYARRKKLDLPQFDLIVIDEAHYAVSPSFRWLVEKYAGTFFLPVTATPHVKDGLRHVADHVVYPITIRELIEQNYLVGPEYYAPSTPDLSRVKVDSRTGDFDLGDLEKAMSGSKIYGDMIASYKRFAFNRPTLLFCVSVEHSKNIEATFNAAGISTEHIDAKMPTQERNEVLERLESGLTKVVTNVGIFTTGVDIPSLGCVMLARPTKSYNLYIQILGRGTRAFPGKKNFIVLDHADCINRHGLIECEKLCNLDGENDTDKPVTITCSECYHVWDPFEQFIRKFPKVFPRKKDYICEGVVFLDGATEGEVCGHDNKPESDGGGGPRTITVEEEYDLQKISDEEIQLKIAVQSKIVELCQTAVTRDYKPHWVWHRVASTFGEKAAADNKKQIYHTYKSLVKSLGV